MKPIRHTLAAMALMMTCAAAEAETYSGTLKKIQETGVITLGHRESSVPFSYYNDKQQVIGYSHELMLKAVEAIRATVKKDDLQIRLLPVTSANRITLVQNGSVDLECGSTTHNPERARQVAFSTTIFIVSTRLLTKKDSGVLDFPDLAGKNMVTTAGTTSERLIRKMNEEKKMRMNIISAKDHGESFLTLETGRAAAFMMDDALLYGEVAKSKRPGEWRVTGTPQSSEAYACMMRRDDPAFKAVVDQALTAAMTTGEAERLYQKWFRSPIPPKGLNLEFELPDAMRALFKNPNDKSFD